MSEEFICSPSTLNLFLKDPCLFILKYFFKMTSDFNIHAKRGVAVEDGINNYLLTKNKDASIKLALDRFEELTFFDDDCRKKLMKVIPEWVNNGIDILPNLPILDKNKLQQEVSFEIHGLKFRGYLDYLTEGKESKIIDLKTANTVPKILVRGPRKNRLSKTKIDNIRQQCLYMFATDKQACLWYLSSGDYLLYDIPKEDYKEIMESVKEPIEEIRRLVGEGLEYGLRRYKPNTKLFSSFYYNELMINKCKQLWSKKND